MEYRQTESPVELPKSFQLSEQEKAGMRFAIEAHMAALPPGLIRSNWMRFVCMPAAMALVVVFLCAGTSYAAYGAVPGDFLYPVKIHVNEPVRLALAFTQERRARTEERFATQRVAEAKELKEQGTLDEETAHVLQKSFETHTAAARAYRGAVVAIDEKPLTPLEIYNAGTEVSVDVEKSTVVPAGKKTLAPKVPSVSAPAQKVTASTTLELVPALVASTTTEVSKQVENTLQAVMGDTVSNTKTDTASETNEAEVRHDDATASTNHPEKEDHHEENVSSLETVTNVVEEVQKKVPSLLP